MRLLLWLPHRVWPSGGSFRGEELRTSHGGTHGYFPVLPEVQTGYIWYGAGFRRDGSVIPVMSLQDIAPMVTRLLAISFSSAEGGMYPGIFQSKDL